MKAANDNAYDPNDLPCGRMSIPHFLAKCAEGIRIAESVDRTKVDGDRWREIRRELANLRRLQQLALKRGYDPKSRSSREEARRHEIDRLQTLLERSPFSGIKLD